MRIVHSDKYKPGVYVCNPWFFWQTCSKCKKNFRREKGFRALVGPWINRGGTWKYICQACCPNRDYAHKYFMKYTGMPIDGNGKIIRPPHPKGQHPSLNPSWK